MNVDDKKVFGDSGEGITKVSGGTDEGIGRVYACTNVVGSDGAAAAVIAVVTQGMLLREILTALRPALVAEALRSGIGAPDNLTLIELQKDAAAAKKRRNLRSCGVRALLRVRVPQAAARKKTALQTTKVVNPPSLV